MKKLLMGIMTLTAFSLGLSDVHALSRFTTYTPLNNSDSLRTYYPGITNRYDRNGRRVGTYVTNSNGITRSYDRYGRQSGVFIPANRVNNRASYYNRYNPAYYHYNGGFGGLKSYNRFGRRIR